MNRIRFVLNKIKHVGLGDHSTPTYMNTSGFKGISKSQDKTFHSLFFIQGPKRKREDRRRIRQQTTDLALTSALLHGTSLSLLSLTVQELALLVSAQATQDTLSLFLLDLLGGDAALLGLLFFLNTAQLLDLLLTDVADLAHHLGTEVGGGNKLISQAKELVEQREGGGVAGGGGGEVSGELNALLGNGLLDSDRYG
jgi:hypothetical protein